MSENFISIFSPNISVNRFLLVLTLPEKSSKLSAALLNSEVFLFKSSCNFLKAIPNAPTTAIAPPIAPAAPKLPIAPAAELTLWTKPPTAVPELDIAFIKLPVAFVFAIILKKVDSAVAPFPNTVVNDPTIFNPVPKATANSPNFATAATTFGLKLPIILESFSIPVDALSTNGNKLCPNLVNEFLSSFSDFFILYSVVSAIVLKASSVNPALLAISDNVWLKNSPSLDNKDIAESPASVLDHKLLKASSLPWQESLIILRTSYKLFPSFINVVNDLPVFSTNILLDFDPSFPSSCIIAFNWVWAVAAVLPCLVNEA